MRKLFATTILLALAAPAFAQEAPGGAEMDAMLDNGPSTHPAAHHRVEEVDNHPHPILSEDSAWAGNLLIVIASMFAAAAFIGPGLHQEMPAAMQPSPDEHGHDEHGDSHGHDSHGHH